MEKFSIWADGQLSTTNNRIGPNIEADIKLLSSSSHPNPSLQFKNATLSWLAYVPTSCVPLHHIAGPALNCTTQDDSTEAWLAKIFLASSNEDEEAASWWSSSRPESDIGVVFKVQDSIKAWKDGPAITEILLYAARGPSLLPSTDPSDMTIQIWALPLSSQVGPSAEMATDVIPAQQDDGDTIKGIPLLGMSVTAVSEKRAKDRLAALFEHAARQNRRLISKGGNSVAKVMPRQEVPMVMPGHATAQENGRRLSGNAAQKPSPVAPLNLHQSRPASRHDALDRTKRSSLVRVQSANDLDMASPQLEGPALRNKTALQRAVLTGMRMYGLQQRKRQPGAEMASRAGSEAPGTPFDAVSQSDDDEFRAVYHQTYKSAAFALRKQFTVTIVDQDAMRDVVDQFLVLFCQGSSQGAAESVEMGF